MEDTQKTLVCGSDSQSLYKNVKISFIISRILLNQKKIISMIFNDHELKDPVFNFKFLVFED